MFGRKKAADEDPFAALNQGGTYESRPTTTIAGIPGSGLEDEPTVVPSSAPIPVAPPTRTPTSASTLTPTPAPMSTPATPPSTAGGSRNASLRRRRGMTTSPYRVTRTRRRGALTGWLVVLGVIAAIVIPVISSASHAIHSFRVPGFTVPNFNPPTVTQSVVPSVPKYFHDTNYLKPAGVRVGLRRIARQFPGARLSNLRVDGNSLDAFVFPRHGGVKDLHLSASGTSVSSSSSPGEKPIAISAIPVAAVPRIVSEMRSQFQIPASRIDYIVLSTVPGLPAQWIAFSKTAAHTGYAAGLDGTGLHKL